MAKDTNSQRARRRADLQRMKTKAKVITRKWGCESVKLANNLAACSCWACGNPRRHFAELTMAEKKADDAANEEFE